MTLSRQTVAQTLDEVLTWRPAFGPVLQAFKPLLAARAELAGALAADLRAAGLLLPALRTGRAVQGVPLLAGTGLAGAAGPLRACAQTLLPLLAGLEALTPYMPALRTFFLRPTETHAADAENRRADSRETLAEALVAGDREEIARIAGAEDLDPLVLEFAAGFVVSPVLRALASQALPDEGPAPWNEGDIWQQGYCPVCGSLPSLSWLDKPRLDEKNAFLVGGGGKKNLHCGLCGADWHFRRGACPSCGREENGVMEILQESGPAHGERLEWCTRCKSYCPSVDLRERAHIPDLDAAAIGMIHLDMVAARKELRPLRPAFWNTF